MTMLIYLMRVVDLIQLSFVGSPFVAQAQNVCDLGPVSPVQ